MQPLADGQTSDISPQVRFACIYGINKIIRKGIDDSLKSEAVDVGKSHRQGISSPCHITLTKLKRAQIRFKLPNF